MAEEVNLRERISQEISQGFSYATGTVSRHVFDVVGDELGPLVEDIKFLASGISSFFTAGMAGIQSLIPGLGKDPQEEVLDETEKQTKLLNKIWGYFSWKRKKDARTFDEDEDDDGIINAIIRGLTQGLAAGGMMGILSGVGAGIGSLFASGLGLLGTGGLIFLLGKMIYDGIIGWLEGKTLIDKSILAATGILSLPGKILEWVTNSVLWALGKDFRVDFGKDKIEQGLRDINNWLFDNFTKPIFINFPNKLKELYNKYLPEPIRFGLESAVKDIVDKLKWPAKILNNSLSYIKNLLTGNLTSAEQDVKNITNNLINMGKDIFNSIDNWLMNNTPIGDTVNGLVAIKDFFTKQWEGGKSILDDLINIGKDVFGSIGNWLMNNTPIGWTYKGLIKVKDFFTKQWESDSIFSDLINIGQDVFNSIGSWIKDYTPIGWTYKGLNSVKDFFTKERTDDVSILDGLINIGKDVFGSVGNWLTNNTPIGWTYKGLVKVKDFFTKERKDDEQSLFDKIVEDIKDVTSKIVEFFQNLIPSWEDIKTAINNYVPNSVSDFLGLDRRQLQSGDVDKDTIDKVKKRMPMSGMRGSPNKYYLDEQILSGIDEDTAKELLNRNNWNYRTKRRLEEIAKEKGISKDVENKKRSNEVVSSVDTEKVRYENESRKKQEQRDKVNTEQLKQAKEDMIRREQQNMNTISMFQANNNQNVQQRSSKDESPEEVESAIMTIMNNSSFGL